MAVEAPDFLTRLLRHEDLQRFATYFHLSNRSAGSHHIAKAEVKKFAGSKSRLGGKLLAPVELQRKGIGANHGKSCSHKIF